MEIFFVDRIEEYTVFCEDVDGKEVRIDKRDIKGAVNEGDVIAKDEGGNMYVDAEATVKRRKRIAELRKYVYSTKTKTSD